MTGMMGEDTKTMGNDLGMGLKRCGIAMTDTFGLNQFAPTASNVVLQINPPMLDFGLQQANVSDRMTSENRDHKTDCGQQ